MKKTGDFVNDTYAGYYRWERESILAAGFDRPETTFNDDFRAWLLDMGVPSQYAGNVAYVAYEQGHSGGESEIVNCAFSLIEIFTMGQK